MVSKSKLSEAGYRRQINAIEKYKFQKYYPEKGILNKNTNIFVDENTFEKLKEIPEWREKIRQFIFDLVS
ncbi:MAG: hypothetical protein O4859_22460 [Trichodesmium sp. St18_bin1]|jgi:hypothetical protein|nr:hypothetical protein [Trichodesmium sp. St18_bin1]MDE5121983.1 hypothetical protein [Trichodesmium sp. St19_bin1]